MSEERYAITSHTGGHAILVDPEDYQRLSQYKWYVLHSGRRSYAIRNAVIDGKHTTVSMHREILGFPKDRQIDHINRNGLDNRRENLRVVGPTENCINRDYSRRNKSGYRGVSWYEPLGKWRAKVTTNNKSRHLGYFADLEEAARAYDQAAIAHHGPLAQLNFPDEQRVTSS